MIAVRFRGLYEDFITARDVDSAVHYTDASDPTCIGFVDQARAGDEVIERAEYDSLKTAILAYNATLPEPVQPTTEPNPDARQAALLEGLAVEWEQAAADLRAGNPSAAAAAMGRAAEKAKVAAAGLRGDRE